MREILFRGKTRNSDEWYYGCISGICATRVDENHNILDIESYWLNGHVLDAKTVGQYTGLTDKNGTKIFEGDILNIDIYSSVAKKVVANSKGKVIFKDGAFGINEKAGFTPFASCTENVLFEVVGNIHDNKELYGNSEQLEG